MIVHFRPLQDYAIHEPARLIIYDNQTTTVILKKELMAGEEYCLSIDDLAEHLDYTFKIQTKAGGAWTDVLPYSRLLPESQTKDGIKYLFYPYKGSDKLVVVFQAIQRKPGYNYVRTLSGVKAHRLYIKDDYGEDPETRTSYYLGKNRTFDIADKVQHLIEAISSLCGLRPDDCIFTGSSKGGFAALYHGYRFGAGYILPGGPQVLLGRYLNSTSAVHPPILDYLAGGRDKQSVAWADGVLKDVILSARAPFPHTEIHVGRNEPHYRKHVVPFLELVARTNIPNVAIDLGDYGTHRELATYFPRFLRDRVDTIIARRRPMDLSTSVKESLMIPYEDISVVDEAVSATEIIKTGWSRRNYPLISLNDPIPWALQGQQERSWNFYIHCWDMVDSLLKTHSESQDKEFLSPAIRIAENWADENSDRSRTDISPFAWYDMAVGLRAYRLAYIIDAGTRSGLLDRNLQNKLWASLEQHQAYLADDTNIQFHNNHGFYQVVGQLAMGRRFAHKSPTMSQASEQGRDRLKVMLAQQFCKDGVHREHSPDYHLMVYETLKAIINSGLVKDPDTIALAEQIEKTLSWFVLPNQHIANFGDTDYHLMGVTAPEAERKWRTAEMRFVVTAGQVGLPPAEAVAFFLEGGYVAVRRPAKDTPQDFSKSSYLAQIAAFHSRTHKHADDLSFIWSDRGSDILVDAGRYGYLGRTEEGSDLWADGHWYSDPNRVYCESTRAHNVLEFDEKNYLRKGVKPYGSALRRLMRDASGLVAVESECRHFRSIRCARVLLFMPSKWLVVFDWFHDNAQQPHRVKQWFHVAPHLELVEQAGSYVVSVPHSPQPLRIFSLLEGPTACRPYLGEKEPSMQGWWSEKERTIVPNYAFCYELSGVSNGTFATLFNFSEGFSTDTNWNKANMSGRKARFRWMDDAGTHELRLERPETGEMSIGYGLG